MSETDSKPTRQKNPIFKLFIALSICLVMAGLLEFMGGYRGMHLVVFGILPVVGICALCAIVLVFIIIGVALKNIFQAKSILGSVLLAAFAVGLLFTYHSLPFKPYLFGFKCRVLKISSPKELRQIAEGAHSLIPDSGILSGRKSLYDSNSTKLWARLPQTKILNSWRELCKIDVSDSAVEIYWGGGLIGIWGIRIQDRNIPGYGLGETIQNYESAGLYYIISPIDERTCVFMRD